MAGNSFKKAMGG